MMTSSGFTYIFPSPIEPIKFINKHNLDNLENHNINNFEFVEPAMLLLSLSKAEPKYPINTINPINQFNPSNQFNQTNMCSNILGKRVRFNIPEESVSKRPFRNVNSTYASNNNYIKNEINSNTNTNTNTTNRIRNPSKFEPKDQVRIIKNGIYYDYEGVITDGGNGFYSVLIEDIEEILKFRAQELELIE